MKILVINGSPKRDNSDTMHITRTLLEGMREEGDHEIDVIHAVDRHVEYCTGCFTCMHNGGTCVYNDDMRDILDMIVASDLVILSFPLYCYGMPAPLKAVMDRTLPLSSMAMRKEGDRYRHVGQTEHSHIRFMMVCGCGFPNSRHNFEPAELQFKLMFPGDPVIITVPESPMFNAPEAVSVTEPRLELVRRAGRQFAEAGEIAPELLSEICSPMIPEEVYAEIVNRGA